ncbi:hypothetical protein AAHN97_08390 [Chitinophaga niabensis]|uniref:hypothetical protein n=1 Tax=Chitinophaga niabensis TaxID=536979 RepID=UPI0031BAB9CA
MIKGPWEQDLVQEYPHPQIIRKNRASQVAMEYPHPQIIREKPGFTGRNGISASADYKGKTGLHRAQWNIRIRRL